MGEHAHMADTSIMAKAVEVVGNYIEAKLEKTDEHPAYYMYVVWFSKTLQNWKALVSSSLPDGMYYEVTYDGDRKMIYLDAYKKFDNVAINDAPTGIKNYPHTRHIG